MRCSAVPVFAALVSLAGCTTQDMANVLGVDLGSSTGPGGTVTYYKDVLPVAQEHCTTCHYPGGIGPFSMLTYEDALPHAQVIAEYVKTGQMPPWKPADGCRTLRDTRKLSDAEIATFTSWVAQSSSAGNASDAPPPPAGSTGLSTISVSMKMPAPYTPPLGVTDHYQCFILDPKLTTNVDLVGYDVHPGIAAEVHHVLLYPTRASDAQALDDASPDEVGWTCFGGPGTPSPHTVGGWVPGSSAVRFPATTGIALTAGEVMVMQVHYNLNYVAPTADQTSVDLQYASAPVSLHAQVTPILNASFSIAPGATDQAVQAQLKLPKKATVWGTMPHAHTNAQKMHVESDAGCMVDIPSWDFHWQQMYFFDEPMQLTPGQQLRLTCTYDNPGAKPLTWGENRSDEMCLNYFDVTQQ